MWLELSILVSLILLNGVFAGAEIATISVRKTRIEQLLESGHPGARAVAALRANPERLLATVQVGITFIGAAAAAYGGDIFSDRLADVLQPLLGNNAGPVALAIVIVIISFLSLVLGELVPKSLAMRSAEAYALLVGRPLVVLAQAARPLVWILTRTSNLVLSAFGDSTSFTESRISPEELKTMLNEAGAAGALHPKVGEIASRAMDLNDLTAYDIMVPRHRIVALRRDATIDEFRVAATSSSHSRFPVFVGDVDHICGFVTVRDVFTKAPADGTIEGQVRPIPFVPETARATDILHTLRGLATELAIVVDEHGGTAGLVTREDLTEELFGHATGTPDSLAPVAERQTDDSIVAEGMMPIRDLNRDWGFRLPESDEWATIGGLCIGWTNRIPSKGDFIHIPSVAEIEVLDASPRRVRSVRIRRLSPENGGT